MRNTPRNDRIEHLLSHRAWLAAMARDLVRDPATAEDIVQETWAAALSRPPRGPVRPWLAAVARRAALFLRRGEAHRRARERAVARPEASCASEEALERLELEERLACELRALDEPFRTTLLQRYVEGLSAAEIARRGGLPEGTVRWRTKRGLEALRQRLEQGPGKREGPLAALLSIARTPAPPERIESAPAARWAGVLGTGGLVMTLGGKTVAAAVVVLTLLGLGLRYRSASTGDGRANAEGSVPSSDALGATPRPAAPSLPRGSVREPLAAAAGRETGPPARARVQVLEWDRKPLANRLVVWLPRADEALASARTDAHGWLEFAPDEEPREAVIERSGAVPFRTEIERNAGVRELVLPEGGLLEGRIVVDGGAPPRPLELEVFPARSVDELVFAERGQPEAALRVELTTVRTDADGRFLVRGLDAGQGANLRFPEGYARPGCRSLQAPMGRLVLHVARPARGLALEVERFPSVYGRLVEADGKPTAGAVTCRLTSLDGNTLLQGLRAEDDGVFELFFDPDEAPRAFDLEYWGTPGMRGTSRASVTEEDLARGGDLGDLRLARGRDVLLRVRDGEGRPLAGARTTYAGGDMTDARGEIRLRQITSPTVRVAARGHREASVELPALEEDASASPETVIELTLERAPELDLELRDVDGHAPGEVLVELESPTPFFGGADGRAVSALLGAEGPGRRLAWGGAPFRAQWVTDAEGRLRVDSLRAGVPLVLRVLVPGGVALEQRLPALGPEEWRALELPLEIRARRIRARVVDEGGQPVSGVRVGLPEIRGNGSHRVSMRTDRNGRFEALTCAPSEATLTLSLPGFRARECELDALGDAETTLVLARGRQLVVTVRDESDRLQDGGRLFCNAPGGVEVPEPTTPGRWEFRELGDEELDLRLAIGGGLLRRRARPDTEVEFHVPVMGAVELRWDLGRDSEVPEWTRLVLEPRESTGEPMRKAFHARPRGTHRFDPVLPGCWEARLLDANSERVLASVTVTVPPGGTVSADL